MRFLLEFNKHDDLSIIKDVVEDVFLSEIDESMSPVVKQCYLTIENYDFKTYDFKSDDLLVFDAYEVKFRNIRDEDVFQTILNRVSSILKVELDSDMFSFYRHFERHFRRDYMRNSFLICKRKDHLYLKSILEFEEEVHSIELPDKYVQTFDVVVKAEDYKYIEFWISEFENQCGIKLYLIRKQNKGKLNYKKVDYNILLKFIFLENGFTKLIPFSMREVSHYDSLEALIKNNKKLKDCNLNSILSRFKEFKSKIDNLEINFSLDINSEASDELDRFVNILSDKLFPIFHNKVSIDIEKLIEQFVKLLEYEIDATWDFNIDKDGNYFYTFDINYRNNFYILKLKYNKLNSKVSILIGDIKEDEILIEDVCENIYLLLNRNIKNNN